MMTPTENPGVDENMEDNCGACKGCGVTWKRGKPHIIWTPCLARNTWVGREGCGWHVLWPCHGMFPYCKKCHVGLSKFEKLRCIAVLVFGSWFPRDPRGLRGKLWCIAQFCMAAVRVGFFEHDKIDNQEAVMHTERRWRYTLTKAEKVTTENTPSPYVPFDEVDVDFRLGVIRLPEGEFSLTDFMRVAKTIRESFEHYWSLSDSRTFLGYDYDPN